MVVAGRLLWIIEKIKMGHQVLVTSSFNTTGEKQKLKVLIQPIAGAVFGPEINQCIALAAVGSLSDIANKEPLARSVCLTDRGHKHSNGVSEVSFWMVVKKAVFEGNGVKEAEDKTVVTETHASSHEATGSFPTHDRAVERDIEEDDYFSGVGSLHDRSQSNAASADGEEKRGDADDPDGSCDGAVDCGEDLTGIGVDLVSSEGASGSIVRNTGVQEEEGGRPKKPRLLVEM